MKDTAYIGDLKLPITLHKALVKAIGPTGPHTYGEALKVRDSSLLHQRGVGRRTVAKWTAFKAANPVRPSSGDPIWPHPSAPAVAPVLTQDHAARIADAERAEIERLRVQLTDAVRQRDAARREVTLLNERYNRLRENMTVAQLRTLGYEVEVYEG